MILMPLKALQRNCASHAGRLWPKIECCLGSFVIFQGIRASVAKESYSFVIFQGVRRVRTPLTPLDARVPLADKE